MNKLPSMPFVVDAYLKDTAHLSLEEHGAYLLLLMAMWRGSGFIQDDDRGIARLLGVSPRAWLRLKQRLLPFLEVLGGRLSQKRLQIQWNYAQENRLRQVAKGKAGAKERWERNQILKSSTGYSPSIGTGNSGSSSRGNSRTIAIREERNITTTSNLPRETEEGAQEKGKEEFPELPANLNRLLQTTLMRRTS